MLLAVVVRAEEAESEGVRLGDAEEEEELEEVSELELLEVPEKEDEPVCEAVRVVELLGVPVEVPVRMPALLPEGLPVPEELRVVAGLSEGVTVEEEEEGVIVAGSREGLADGLAGSVLLAEGELDRADIHAIATKPWPLWATPAPET